jgi:hypothetical protein
MKLDSRLARLEAGYRTLYPEEDQVKVMRRLVIEWMEKEPQAVPLFKAFEDYCRKNKYKNGDRNDKELIESDPEAVRLNAEWVKSYQTYVHNNYGVMPT